MSNHKAGENPAHRISKVSHATSIGVGLVGPKARPKGVADGQQVNIPAPRENRQRASFENFVGHFRAFVRNIFGGVERSSRRGGTEWEDWSVRIDCTWKE